MRSQTSCKPANLPRLPETLYDVAVIGAGIIGCAAAFELSRTTARVALLERGDDVAQGATRANSGIVHAGYDPKPGTRMARYNVEGNALTSRYAKELNVPFRNNGSLVLALKKDDLPTLLALYDRGLQNGVPGLRMLTAEETLKMEPHLSPSICGALYAPSAGIISPWEMALAFAESAVQNGCDFLPCCEVAEIRKDGDQFVLTTPRGKVKARRIVNAAGGYADAVNDMAAPPRFHIRPNRGQYYLLDKSQGDLVSRVVFQCPTAAGKGVLVSPTVHGNLIIGPDAVDVDDPDDTATTADALAYVAKQARLSVPDFNLRESIRNFAGVRAISDRDDFIIEESPDCPGFINLSGIKSPGLTSAPAIAADCVKLLQSSGLELKTRDGFRLCPRPKHFRSLTVEERAEAARSNPLYGRIICRCETVTEGEIVDAIHEPIPARSIDAVKRRCNAGMGRCQGGFCGPRVASILAREWGIPLTAVRQDKPGTNLFTGWTKEGGDRI